MNKLNFGCGSIQPEGWDNLDSDDSFYAEFRSTLGVNDTAYDMIVAHCCIQMNEFKELPALFKDLHALLRHGGVLRISLPDIAKGFEAYKRGDINWFPNSEPDIDIRFSAWLTWYSTTKTLLTQDALMKMLLDAGFSAAKEVAYKQSYFYRPETDSKYHNEIVSLDTRNGECYFVEALR